VERKITLEKKGREKKMGRKGRAESKDQMGERKKR